jgi:hypothetical protein
MNTTSRIEKSKMCYRCQNDIECAGIALMIQFCLLGCEHDSNDEENGEEEAR